VISQRCLKYWKHLPISARAYYDLDDMIAEVVLHVVSRASKYNAAKAKEVTWVYWVADNYCKLLLTRYGARKLTDCTTTTLSDPETGQLRRTLQSTDNTTRIREAVDAIERVIDCGSDAVCDLMEILLEGRFLRRWSSKTLEQYITDDHEVVDELRQVMDRCHATVDDLRLVMQVAVS